MLIGNLQCFGSSSHLKNKFGQGFTILTKIPATGKNGGKYKDKYDNDDGKEKDFQATRKPM